MNNTFQNTNYYNDIMKAYDAGVSKDTATRDTLVRSLNNSLSNSCKTYVTNPNIVNNSISRSGSTPVVDLEMYSGKYRNDIEFQNSIKDQLIADEETYFINKYGSVVYKYLTDKRSELMKQLDASSNTCSSMSQSTSRMPSSVVDSTTGNIIGNYDSSGNFVTSPSIYQNTQLEFYNMFSKYLPYIDPDVINRKIEYRETEHDFLMKINSIMNGIYYILFVIMVILLIGSNNIQLKQRMPIYIFLLVLPFLYPYFFKAIYFIYVYFTDNKNIHGPKNAFLDTNGEKNMIDAYNN